MQKDMVPRIFNRNIKLIFVIAAFIIMLIWLYRINIQQRLLIRNTIYTIVIDAGSTGSRLHVFKLNHDDFESKKFDIQLVNEELLLKVKPGLSAYSQNPKIAADSIEPLLIRALEVIPSSYHSYTRLSLKATAGLRLVSDKIADKILDHIRDLFKKYPFRIKTETDVAILDGKFEGIYSWLTLNYALKSFETFSETSICSLDMGGGSTQVTFIPSQKISNEQNLVSVKIDRTKYNMFAKSFLGFGLMSARLSIIQNDPINLGAKENRLFSRCIPNGKNFTWSQQGKDFLLSSSIEKNSTSYENCSKIVSKTIGDNFEAPPGLESKNIYAFSFYYDRLNNAKLFGDQHGGLIRIEKIKEAAKLFCNGGYNQNIDSEDKDFGFLCMDLTFIYSILVHGYGLSDAKEIFVSNQVNGMEISWALGAAFHMLNQGI
ncbi:ectonucleoside triphosphate diphosphohydrolase 5 isoform X1 [Brachionus plicatilis]|uniref:Ectonucleoside triphosphate diphosphohydrolase 5 isoform X1 n=1 Tax=Brachionus plicatilis TaxID=10195 RepID=A0A3M7P321_BRAPC|nr:ectonucleoside triphosphate diphosphohydrolase 5 isoform X1 [Brachionus plicatilis]